MVANSITLIRIFFLPIPCLILLFFSPISYWAAFILFVFLGTTDFIDGSIARREGPTILGAFLDPVADKIFIAAIVLSLSGNKWIPYWFPAAILFREFLLTVLRSSLMLRNEYIKTSLFAKIKTIIQMGGFGTIFITLFLPLGFSITIAVLFFMLFIFIYSWCFLFKINTPYWLSTIIFAFLYWFILLILIPTKMAVTMQCYVILGITWISSFEYFRIGFLVYKNKKPEKQDIVRLLWAISHSIYIAIATFHGINYIIPILINISFELGLGGIDNILAIKHKLLNWKLFLASSLSICLLLPFFNPEISGILTGISAVCFLYSVFKVRREFVSI